MNCFLNSRKSKIEQNKIETYGCQMNVADSEVFFLSFLFISVLFHLLFHVFYFCFISVLFHVFYLCFISCFIYVLFMFFLVLF